ncbi:MAG: fibrobacter succinogenes major paralogous domain-containing protein [Paludibacter sp.]|jgi:uncharacterized protein (TIGR02145 family)|nr:fibrobacter succinogenes major paralogous domain-containing protein [Paludibacter sp.]
MRTVIISFFLVVISQFLISCDKEISIVEITLPTVETVMVNNDLKSAYLEAVGSIISCGKGTIFEKGFIISLQPELNMSEFKWKVPDSESPIFSMRFDQYEKNKTIYIRAYAINEVGIGYGQVVEVFTHSYASVSTLPAKVQSDTEVLLSASVNPYNSDVEIWFEVWNSNDGLRVVNVPATEVTSDTEINTIATGLTPGETYSFTANVKNFNGTATGKINTFTLPYELVEDFDKNVYWTYKIGNQIWLVENLKTTHFLNGDFIPEIQSNDEWVKSKQPAYCYYDNDQQLGNLYGSIYNNYVGWDSRGLIKGYRVPSIIDYKILIEHLGGPDVAAKKLRSNTDDWKNNSKGTNISGFTLLPGGWKGTNETFSNIGTGTVLQTTTMYKISEIWALKISESDFGVFVTTVKPFNGTYIRLIKMNKD